MNSPFTFLTAAQLNSLARFFAADPAAVSVEIPFEHPEHGTVFATIRPVDLALIHSMDASRFGFDSAACPMCEVLS